MILSVCPNPSIDTYSWLNDFIPGNANRITRQEEFPGGKGIHVALAVNELGSPTRLLGNWAGNTGDWIRVKCKEKGIETIGPQLKGTNRKCYTFRSERSEFNNSELLEPGPEISLDNFNGFTQIFEEEIKKSSLACMSGSWPKNAPVDSYKVLIGIANRHNKNVIIDCSGDQLKLALEAEKVFGIHINEHEAEDFFGTSNFDEIITQLKTKVSLIALTKGKKGLWLYYKGKVVTANVVIDRVVSTVGSGDCLTAGIAFAVSKNFDIEEVAKYGVACGAANCLNEDLGMLKMEDVLSLVPKVKINSYENAK